MAQGIKAVDGRINLPRALGGTAQQTVAAEKDAGQGGLYQLFPDYAARQKDVTPEELVAAMDAAGVEKGVLAINAEDEKDVVKTAMKKYPGKFVTNAPINPVEKGIMNEVRRVKSLVNDYGLQAIRVGGFRLGVPPTDNRLFPFYALAIEYDLKVYINVGYPGPPGLARTQDPHHVDEICYLFPELKVVQIHGSTGNPYMEVAVHNIIKYPNCYLLTDTYRPKYFPPEFVQHLNTRAQDKVLWGTAYPIVNFKTSLDDVKELPLREHVRPKYLRENALRLFRFG
ncbi:MAG: amidohydrolase family protein [Chloroflexota bacterium]|nr:amidohydrolase family protein [Chloroflexota bacterium]